MPRVKKEISSKGRLTSGQKTEEKIVVKEVKVQAKGLSSSGRKGGLTAKSYSLKGEEAGTVDLPAEIFGGKINQQLLAQAMRVYLNNLKAHFSHTKTRSEVIGSTRKIRAQKGTGGARHGSIKAPIFVGGGIALGPKFRKVELEIPKKMKRAALISALSLKAKNGEVIAVEGLDKLTGKTKQMDGFLKKVAKNKVLIVADGKDQKLMRAVRNLQGMEAKAFDQINAFEVIAHQTLIFTKEAVEKLESKIMGKKEEKE